MTVDTPGYTSAKRAGRRVAAVKPAAAQFYKALADLSEAQNPKQTCRRTVMGLVQGISARLRTQSAMSGSGTGLPTSVHYIVVLLYRANAEHTVKVREIQRGLGFTAGGVTRRLDAMVRDGLLVRCPDPGDGRAWLATLTPAGAALAKRLLSQTDARSQRMEDAFTLDEWQQLATLLARLKQLID